jgi:hypothetical protein
MATTDRTAATLTVTSPARSNVFAELTNQRRGLYQAAVINIAL